MPRSPKKLYPDLKDDERQIQRTEEYQSDSESFLGSPKATSTPIADGLTLRKGVVVTKVDETILAGNAGRLSSFTRFTFYGDNSHTNTSIIHSLMSPSEYKHTFEDFKQCCTTGDWWDFICKHHLRILFMIILLLVAGSVWRVLFPISLNHQEQWQAYHRELRVLRKEFPGLTKNDENTLLVIGQQWIIDRRQDPVVLTLGGPNSSSFTEKLYKILVKISNDRASRRPIVADSSVSRGQLHGLVKADLGSSSSAFSALRSVDRLSWDSPLVIHAFSDSDSAIHNSLLLFSVEDVRPGATTCEHDLAEHLTTRWTATGGTSDNIPPIISRILGYTICI